jgi:UDP-hydrolysing UDP-N-acetyl-D-glucosamine 2-epimerase
MKNKVIAVFTGNRAEYGLQFSILKAIKNHPDLEYRLIVSGAHLDKNFGETISEIENDGFEVHAEVKIDLEEDTLYATAQAIGTGILSMSQALNEIRPDILVVYADRFEGFAAVIAGTQMNVPTAHIEGGDITEGGALDDSVRHAMTKLSHLHFTTNQQASNRLLAMGEESWRVHTVGFPAVDLIMENNFAKPREIVEKYGINLDKPVVLFTQHSVTTEFDQADEQLVPSLLAIERVANEGIQVILTYPNNDAGGKRIIKKLEEFVAQGKPNIHLYRSLGRYFYHGILSLSTHQKYQVVCAGNSSSGIKETPAFFCPTVNIGTRQQGRLRAENIIDANYDSNQIYDSIKQCLSMEFRETCNNCSNPYGVGDAGIKIANYLAEMELDLIKLLRKGMTLRGDCNDDGWCR